MTTPDFPGGIAERLDVLMVTIWIVALFFFVSGSIFYGGKMAGRLFNMRKERIALVIVTVLIVGGSMLIAGGDFAYFVYMNYMKYIGVPLLLLILLLVLWKLNPRKLVGAAACLLTIWTLTGCAKGVELEDREFVLTLGVEYNSEKIQFYYDTSDLGTKSGEGGQSVVKLEVDNFHELRSAYGQQSDKYLDCNHLKSIIIGKNLASNPEKLIQLLEYIEENELFAKNVRLFFAEDIESIFKLCEGMDTVLGQYLDNMYVDSHAYVEGQSCTLGALMAHSHNNKEALLVPALQVQEGKPMIGAYALVQSGRWLEQLSYHEGNLIFLGNGVNVRIEPVSGNSYGMEFTKADTEIVFENEKVLKAKVTIHMKGEVISATVKNEKTKRELEKACNKKLEEELKMLLAEYHELDLLHLYRALGSHDRELYIKYEDKREEFMKDLVMEIEVKCKIL